MTRTLGEVAELLSLDKVMKEPERFLTRQIKAGKIRARKFGRHWLMTDADVDFALAVFSNTVTDQQPATADEPVTNRPSRGSLRRRLVVAQ